MALFLIALVTLLWLYVYTCIAMTGLVHSFYAIYHNRIMSRHEEYENQNGHIYASKLKYESLSQHRKQKQCHKQRTVCVR